MSAAAAAPAKAQRRTVETENGPEHPLQSPWCFWYDKKPSRRTDTQEYRAGLRKLGSFNTVESFWKHYLYMKRPSHLENNVNLYLFRDGPSMAPMWECFPHGGCWILKIRKRRETGASVLGKMWHDLVLSCVCEQFEEPDVVGVGIAIRSKEDLISVWNADSRNPDIQFKIGERLKQILELEPSTMIEYKHHFKSMQDQSTYRNAKAYVFAEADENKKEEENKSNVPPEVAAAAAAAAAAIAQAEADA